MKIQNAQDQKPRAGSGTLETNTPTTPAEPVTAMVIGSDSWLAALRDFEKSVYDRHDDFLGRFARGRALELTHLAVDSENVRLVYVLDSGQHIADSANLADVLQWLSANAESSDRAR